MLERILNETKMHYISVSFFPSNNLSFQWFSLFFDTGDTSTRTFDYLPGFEITDSSRTFVITSYGDEFQSDMYGNFFLPQLTHFIENPNPENLSPEISINFFGEEFLATVVFEEESKDIKFIFDLGADTGKIIIILNDDMILIISNIFCSIPMVLCTVSI